MQADGEVDLDKNTYKNLIVSKPEQLHSPNNINIRLQGTIQTSIRASNMDIELPYKDQAQEEIVLVIASVRLVSPCLVSLHRSLTSSPD